MSNATRGAGIIPGMADDDAAADMPVINVDFDWTERWCDTCQANTRHRVTTIATGNEFTLRFTSRGHCLDGGHTPPPVAP